MKRLRRREEVVVTRHEADLSGSGGRLEGEPAHESDTVQAQRILGELAVSAVGIGTFDWNLTNGHLAWDERLIDLFGYRPGEFEESIADFNARVHPADLPGVSARLQATIDVGAEYEATYRIVLPAGTTRWVSARGRALRDESGRTTRILGAAWDVTATREESERLASILESVAVGFFAVDREWRITHVNVAFERVAGMARADVLGRSYWDVFPAAIGTQFESSYRRTMSTGEPTAFDAYYPDPIDVWVEVRAERTGAGMAVYFLDITARRRMQEQVERAARRSRLLGRITEALTTTLDLDDAASGLARLLVPDLGDWVVVTLVDDDRASGRFSALGAVGAAHVDPTLQDCVEEYARHRLGALADDAILAQAMETNSVQFVDFDDTRTPAGILRPGPVRDLLDLLKPAHVAVHPLSGRSGPVGILSIVHGAERGRFTEEDVATASHLAARAGVVLDNARLYRQQRDLAEGLQRSLLTPPAQVDDLEVAVRYTPAAEAAKVGGDWYDAFVQSDGATVVVIGDVVGHDTEAAAAMGQVRTLLRGLGAHGTPGPERILSLVDEVMQTLKVNTTATAVVARLEADRPNEGHGSTRLRWSNAGHPPPLLVRPAGTVETLSVPAPGLMLGVMPGEHRGESQMLLEPGSTLVLYTDGLVERRGQSLDVGLRRLRDLLASLATQAPTLDELCDQLLARLLPARPDDDVAIIAVRVHPSG